MKALSSINAYQVISALLLKKHYGLELGDTRLCEDDYVQPLISAGIRPIDYINQHAEECELERIDVVGWVPSRLITAQDEAAAETRAAELATQTNSGNERSMRKRQMEAA